MTIWKKVTSLILAVCMAVTIMIVPDMDASAKAKVNTTKINIITNQVSTASVYITYSKGDAQIKNIKTNSKNLVARQTSQYYHKEKYNYGEYPYGYARIEMYAKKAGNYKLTFDVCNEKGKKISSHTVKVTASSNTKASEYPIKKVTFAGKNNVFYTLTSKKSGKFKVTTNKGYKVKSIEMKTYAKDGTMVTKKIKNNQKVTLGKYAEKSTYESNYDDSWSYYYSTDMFALTEFVVTYKNTKTKTTGTVTYYIYRMPQN